MTNSQQASKSTTEEDFERGYKWGKKKLSKLIGKSGDDKHNNKIPAQTGLSQQAAVYAVQRSKGSNSLQAYGPINGSKHGQSPARLSLGPLGDSIQTSTNSAWPEEYGPSTAQGQNSQHLPAPGNKAPPTIQLDPETVVLQGSLRAMLESIQSYAPVSDEDKGLWQATLHSIDWNKLNELIEAFGNAQRKCLSLNTQLMEAQRRCSSVEKDLKAANEGWWQERTAFEATRKELNDNVTSITGQKKLLEELLSSAHNDKGTQERSLVENYVQDKASLEKAHSEEIRRLDREHYEEIQRLIANHEQTVADYKISIGQHDAKIQSIIGECDRRLWDKTSQCNAELQGWSQKYENLVITHKSHLQTISSKHKGDFNIAQSKHDMEKTQLLRTAEGEKEEIRRHYQVQIADLEKNKRTSASKYQKLQEEKDKMQTEFEYEIDDLVEKHEAAIAEMVNTHSNEKENMIAAHELEKEKMNQDHASTREDLYKRLRQNVSELTTELTRRRNFKAMSDHEFSQRFRSLAVQIDGLARTTWDVTLRNTWPVPERSFTGLPNERRTKQHVLQSALWMIFYERMFGTPFRVLGTGGKELDKEWIIKFRGSSSTRLLPIVPEPSEEVEEWRYETMKKCVEAVKQGQSQSELGTKYNLKTGYERTLDETRQAISDEITKIALLNDIDKPRVADLVAKAANLWLEVGQQPYRAYLVMTSSGVKPWQDGEFVVKNDGKKELVVVPEIRRAGNAHGERLDGDELVANCKGNFSTF